MALVSVATASAMGSWFNSAGIGISSLSSPLSAQEEGGSSAECRVTVTLRLSETAG